MVDALFIVMPARNVKPILPCWIHVLQRIIIPLRIGIGYTILSLNVKVSSALWRSTRRRALHKQHALVSAASW